MLMPTRKQRGLQVVMVADPNTSKSSLIVSLPSKKFPDNPNPCVVPPTYLPSDIFSACIPLTIVDTSSRSRLRNTR